MNMSEQPPVAKPSKRVWLAILSIAGIYLVGMFALPPAIMATSAAPLATAFNVAYAPVVAGLQHVPVVRDVWNGYMGFLCRKMDYSCSSDVPPPAGNQS